MEFLNYFSNVFTFTNLLILFLGTVGGLLMGAAPGLSPTMAVALLIPFTFKMSPEQGLIMLRSCLYLNCSWWSHKRNSFKNPWSTRKHCYSDGWISYG